MVQEEEDRQASKKEAALAEEELQTGLTTVNVPYKSGAGLPIWYLIVVYKSSLSLGDFVGFFYKDVIAKSIYCILKPKQVLKNPDIV